MPCRKFLFCFFLEHLINCYERLFVARESVALYYVFKLCQGKTEASYLCQGRANIEIWICISWMGANEEEEDCWTLVLGIWLTYDFSF